MTVCLLFFFLNYFFESGTFVINLRIKFPIAKIPTTTSGGTAIPKAAKIPVKAGTRTLKFKVLLFKKFIIHSPLLLILNLIPSVSFHVY